MGNHSTWFDLFPGYETLKQNLQIYMGREWTWQIFQDTHFEITHIMGGLLVVVLACFFGLGYLAEVKGSNDEGLVPPAKFGIRALMEGLADIVYGLMESAMGTKDAPEFLPLIGTLFVFILFCNLLGLIPGFLPPTDTLKTNLAIAGLVFVMTHVYGFKSHGIAYLKHFIGPVWWLAWLMLPIELVSHVARPVSLSMRLLGNITADHKVGAVFFGLIPFLVPVPFLVMGVFVSIVQAVVFSLLSTIYIATSVAHEEH